MKEAKYNLEAIKRVFSSIEKLNMTYSAIEGQYDLGFSDQDVVDAIQALTNLDFYKSMLPEHKGFSAWQDVYKSMNVELYIKFQIDKHGELIVSFKAR